MPTQAPVIPIKNLFYMLCYAWNVLSVMDDIKVGSDDYEDAYNLLSRVFSYGVGKLIRSGFHRSYVEQNEEVSTVRGKILVQESMLAMAERYAQGIVWARRGEEDHTQELRIAEEMILSWCKNGNGINNIDSP